MSKNNFTGPVNIGNPSELSILELAELIIRKTKSSSKITHEKIPVDDPTRRKPDISLAKTKLGWSPKVDLEEGIEKTIKYFKAIL